MPLTRTPWYTILIRLPLPLHLQINLPFPSLCYHILQRLASDRLTNCRISLLNISWYRAFFISSSATYYRTKSALSRNIVVISTTISVVWRRSWDSRANYCTSITGANSALNLVTKSFQVIELTQHHPWSAQPPPTNLMPYPSEVREQAWHFPLGETAGVEGINNIH